MQVRNKRIRIVPLHILGFVMTASIILSKTFYYFKPKYITVTNGISLISDPKSKYFRGAERKPFVDCKSKHKYMSNKGAFISNVITTVLPMQLPVSLQNIQLFPQLFQQDLISLFIQSSTIILSNINAYAEDTPDMQFSQFLCFLLNNFHLHSI